MTEFLDVPGGRIAYDVTGSGPLVVLSHSIGDRRQAYRFLAPVLAQAGGPLREPSTPERSAQGPSLRPARAPATVADITRPSPATVGEYDHIAAAAYLMKHARSAAVVVLGAQQGNRPVGVITEAGIARAVADGMDVNKTRIHDLLTARPAAIPAATSIRDAATTMADGGLRQLPATDGTGWIGIVNIADVCGALLGPPAA